MSGPSFLIDVRTPATDLEREVRSGGLFVRGEQHPLDQLCEVTFCFADAEQRVGARVVFADAQGVGLELFVTPPQREALAEKIRLARTATPALAGDLAHAAAPAGLTTAVHAEDVAHAAGAAANDGDLDDAGFDVDLDDGGFDVDLDDGGDGDHDGGDGDGDGGDGAGEDRDGDERAAPRRGGGAARRPSVHERVRRLNLPEQLKLARTGEQPERVLLERLYGKMVWEALLRNPRITAPEVARIARLGALPKPLLEVIVSNAAWLQVPEIRRALLSNARLTAEMIPRVLRQLPRHELKLVPAQTAYPAAVRDLARRMLRE